MADVDYHVVEVEGPEGRFVIRAEPRGVSNASFLLYGSLWLLALLRRKARRDTAWVIRIRPWSDDPLGHPLYEETVPSKACVMEAVHRAEKRVRTGAVRTGTWGDARST
jgi:hypothetical protein